MDRPNRAGLDWPCLAIHFQDRPCRTSPDLHGRDVPFLAGKGHAEHRRACFTLPICSRTEHTQPRIDSLATHHTALTLTARPLLSGLDLQRLAVQFTTHTRLTPHRQPCPTRHCHAITRTNETSGTIRDLP